MLTCAFFSRHLGSKVMAGSLSCTHTHASTHTLHESDNVTDRHSLKELIHIHAFAHTRARTLPGVPWNNNRSTDACNYYCAYLHESTNHDILRLLFFCKTPALLLLSRKWVAFVFSYFYLLRVLFWLLYMHRRAPLTHEKINTHTHTKMVNKRTNAHAQA